MKKCNRCLDEKEYFEFGNDKTKKDGLSTLCKICKRKKAKEIRNTDEYRSKKRIWSKEEYWRKKEIINKKHREYFARNKEKVLLKCKEYYYNNKEKYLIWSRINRANNSGKYRKYVADHRARTLKLLPEKVDHAKILDFYILADKMTKDTGIKYEVDHIIPLSGKGKKGLHTEDNLQVITLKENRKKGNKTI